MAKIYDTLLAEYIKNPGARKLSLDKIADRKFNYEMIKFDDLVKKNKLENFGEVDLEIASKYSAEDVYITYKLFLEQDEELDKKQKEILENIDFPFVDVLKDMEINGVKISRDRLKELGVIFEKEIKSLEYSIFEEVGQEFNINSPKQVGEILFDKLELPKGKKTKTGWSVSAEVLENLAKEFPIAKKIIDYRHFSKLNSTYINGLLDLLDENDLLHTTYNQAVTATGRLSSTNPNLQNIPVGNGIAGEIRSAFISRFDGGKIMAFDYSQVELRLLAIMSDDENLLYAFQHGFDIHQKTAELIFDNPPKSSFNTKGELNKEYRKIAKAVNFGVIYGISGFGLSKMIDISVSDANLYIKRFFESYPKVREFLDKTIKFCEQNGYVETLFGRKRYISGINDSNKIIKNKAEREAINMPIQGTNADIIKIAMLKIKDFLKNKNLKSKLIMQVHDEVVFDVYPQEEEILKKNITEIMENILVGKKINLKVDYEVGNNWKEAK